MTEVISVKFKNGGRMYHFDPCNIIFKVGDSVIVDTQNGAEFATVCVANRTVNDSEIIKPLRKIIRRANERDFKKLEDNKRKEAEAFTICLERIAAHGLDMKLVSVEYSFDSNKIIFFFTSDGRVDFRELVKDLAYRFHTRIELRQIGVRDEAKLLGGLGVCGQPYCCKRFLSDFQPVSIKMAKEQGLSLNPTKISGSCGRLMCCLNYEQDAYEYLNSFTPSVGATVKTAEGLATVTDVNLITGNLFVKLIDSDTIPFKVHRDDVKLVPRTKKRPKDSKKESE